MQDLACRDGRVTAGLIGPLWSLQVCGMSARDWCSKSLVTGKNELLSKWQDAAGCGLAADLVGMRITSLGFRWRPLF